MMVTINGQGNWFSLESEQGDDEGVKFTPAKKDLRQKINKRADELMHEAMLKALLERGVPRDRWLEF